VDTVALRARVKGRVSLRGEGDFDALAFGGQWNRFLSERAPDVLVRVADEQDVVEAVRFARANGLKVAVRGGGHNWAHMALRTGGMLLDLGDLDQVVSIDREARTAVLQPIISNREIQATLNPLGLAYPSGHCPEVKLSGYLLGGGMSWNQGVWGEGFRSVEAIELVTADGELITASESENGDFFWAARGAGSGMFAVAVRYHLRLYPLPGGIWSSGYYYALEQIEEVGGWLGSIAPELSNKIELTLFLVHAPRELADRCSASKGKVGLVTAAVFAETGEEARALLKPLDECPSGQPLMTLAPKPSNFDGLFDLSGSMWLEGRRSAVDAMFYDADPRALAGAIAEHFVEAPHEETLILFSIYTGSDVPAPLPDAAFSMSAKIYGGPWTQWLEPADDAANVQWHERCTELLLPFAKGHYIGESSTTVHPEFIRGSYSDENWQRLSDLRRRYDPERVFFSHDEGLGG
jgi:FAD/FMN-containing dehydrogenase